MAQHKRKNFITQGSLARKAEQPQNHEQVVDVSQIPVIREIQLKKVHKSKKTGMVFRIALVFSLAMLVMFRYARITELGYEYNKYNDLYKEVKAENDRIKVEIEKSINLANIREVAENRLEMRQPDSYQIVPIEVENINITELSEDISEKDKEEKGLIGKVIDLFKGILGFID